MSNRYVRLPAAALVAVGALAGSATADKIDSLSVALTGSAFDQTPVIRVRASSGKWYRAEDTKVWFNVRLSGKASGKGVRFEHVIVGVPKIRSDFRIGKLYHNNWLVGLSGKSFAENRQFSAPGNRLGIMSKEALAACSRLLSSGKKPDRDHTLPLMFRVELRAQIHGDNATDITSKTAVAALPGHVICQKDPHWGGVRTDASRQPKRTDGSRQPKRTDPFKVKTASLSIRSLNKGRCSPRLVELIAQFETNKKGTVKFHLRRNDGTVETISREAKHWGTKWVARYSKVYQFKKTTDRKYMVDVVGHAKATAWKPMTVRCGKGHSAGKGFKLKLK